MLDRFSFLKDTLGKHMQVMVGSLLVMGYELKHTAPCTLHPALHSLPLPLQSLVFQMYSFGEFHNDLMYSFENEQQLLWV